MRRIKEIGYLLLTLFMMVGCISCVGIETGGEVNRAERLKVRALGLLQARTNMDQEEMRKFFKVPGQARLGNITYSEGKIESIEIAEGELTAQVKVRVSMEAMGFNFKDMPQTQSWVWENGDWYMTPAKSSPFSSNKSPRVEDEKSKK